MESGVDLSNLSEKLKLNERYHLKTSDFITDIVNKKLRFVSVIEALSEVLTNQDVAVRERGIDFLSWILTDIPPDLFNEQEIAAVVNFYTDRLKDHHSIIPVTIKGLLAIVKMNSIQKESIKQFLVPLFQEVNCQTQQQSDRYNVFSIIGYIVENHLDVVAAMGSDFVFGIISLADGETDPTNLMLLFQFLPLLLKNIELGHLMEEMFDLLSCYFPVDFNPAASDISITRQDLADGLKNCLSARPDFADHCLPLILEKLDSTLKTARIDSYKLLGACCNTFPVESMGKHTNEIWKIIQKDVLPAVDTQTCEAALYALSELVKLFSSNPKREEFKNFLGDILTSIKTLLNKVEDNLFNHAMSVLFAVSSKSELAAKYVLDSLRFVFSDDAVKTTSQRKIALSSLKPFLPLLKLYRMWDSKGSSLFVEISQFHFKSVALKDTEVQKLAFLGIEELATDFDSTLRNQILTIVVSCIKTKGNAEVRGECLKILRLLGEISSEEVLQMLENSFQFSLDSPEEDLSSFAFALSAVADIGSITHYSVPKIINIISNSVHHRIGLSCLLDCCKRENDAFLNEVHENYNLCERLLTWWEECVPEKRSEDDASLDSLSQILALIVRHQETCVQQSIADKFVPILLKGVDETNPGIRSRNIILIEAILGSVRHNVRPEKYQMLIDRLITLAVRSSNEWIRTSSSRLLASIVNKTAESSFPELTNVYETIFSFVSDSSSVSERLNASCLISWLVKGLLLANSPRLEWFISKWFDLLENEEVGGSIAEGFHTVLKDEDLYLNMKSHCNVKILYRQRFFTYFPRLAEKFHSASESNKANYLLALTRLIKGVPKHVAVTEIAGVVLITSQALDSRRPEIAVASLEILHGFLRDKESILGNYVQSLVPKLLTLARFGGTMKIRMSALSCLYWYAFYPTVTMLPLRSEVVKNLEPCLDDKKRLVRSEAVKARGRWFLVGAPGEETIFS